MAAQIATLLAAFLWSKLLLIYFLSCASAIHKSKVQSCDFAITIANVPLDDPKQMKCLSKCCREMCLFVAVSDDECDTSWSTSSVLPATHNLYTHRYMLSACRGAALFAGLSGDELSLVFSASSTYNDLFSPANSRLHSPWSWSPATLQLGEFIQADMQHPMIITGVATQGNPVWENWITEYIFYYSMNGTTWQNYNIDFNIPNFQGNSDWSTVVKNDLPQPIVARHVRVLATQWYGDNGMRWEVFGCPV